jgi:glutathione S-transferase
MGLIFYAIPPSLYGAKTRIVMRAKGIEWEERLPPGGYGSKAYKEIIPSGTLPAIIEDGFRLAESEAINEYLNETHPNPPMLPESLRGRATARALSRFHDTRLEPVLRTMFSHVDPSRRDPNHIADQATLFHERLEQLSRLITQNPYLTGDDLSLADCGYPITFSMLERLAPELGIKINWPPKVAAYFDALKAHPIVAEELATYLHAIDAWVRSEVA